MDALIRLFQENQYQIVHSNMNALSVFSLSAAAIAKVPVRICHNHSTSAPGEGMKNLIKHSLRPFAKVFPTHLCACCLAAGEWLYGKRTMEKGIVTIINNAIDTKKYAFDPYVRKEVRDELGFDQDTFVIGHVGRFCYQKNQEFLIDIFDEIHRKDPKAVLLLIGIGETQEKIRKKIHSLGLDGSVLITGARSDVDRLYQAMDVFVLPSHYEGLAVACIEAQCAGLPVIVSNAITQEVNITDRIQFLSLASSSEWCDAICSKRSYDRKPLSIPFDPAYDINLQARKLEAYYDQVLQDI